MDQGGIRNANSDLGAGIVRGLRQMKAEGSPPLPADDLIRMAESLRERDSLFLQLTESLAEVLWVSSPDWQQILYVNRAYERLWGRSRQSLYDHPLSWMDSVLEEDREFVMAALKEKTASAVAIPDFPEYRIIRPDGSVRWIMARAFPIRNRNGELFRIAGIAADVTALKQVEEALHFKEDIIQCSSSAIATCNLEGDMTFGNPCFLKTWGFGDPREFLGKPFWTYWLLEDRLDEIMQALRHNGTWFGEIEAVRKDGTLFDVQVSAAMVYDSEGNPAALTSTSIDITRRKEAEQALRESEQRVRMAIKTAGLAIWDWDIVKDTVSWDNPSQIMFDGDEETTFGWWAERIHPDERNAVLSTFNSALAGDDESLVLEYRFRRWDGSWANIYDRSQIMRDESGRACRVVGAVMDITDMRRTEEELRRVRDELELRVKERTAELSRTVEALNDEVLQRIVAEHTSERCSKQVRLLAEDLTVAEQRERERISQVLHDGLQQYLVGAKFRLSCLEMAAEDEETSRAAKGACDLINQSIEIARCLSHELNSPMLRSGLVPSLEWLIRFMERTHMLAVDFQADDSIGPTSEEVIAFLFQSARELLLNLVKHGGVKTARMELSQSAAGIQLVVADEGKGFNPDQLSRDRHSVRGTGLFDIRERLSLLGGRMVIDSAPGKGAKFILLVPPLRQNSGPA